ncbi:protein of unknown function [Massilia sp. PDC64]|nr:DUF4433 domain-containing protein [Massilia sp. PDC64]SDE23063.1 protein of unknown function [Massilia sp. PDC64]
MTYTNLNPEKALIWRIVHRDNIPWILKNGLHCANSKVRDPHYVNIGNVDLIDKRRHRIVPISPGGTLTDYIPFYFTPFSVMMMNIHSGRGVIRRQNEEIVILVSSLYRVKKLGLPFVFTNAHAYPSWTEYYSDLQHLDQIDWPLLQARDFRRDPDDPQKVERYQAEALIYKNLPTQALLGIICYNELQEKRIENQMLALNLNIKIHVRKGWYFQ